MTVDGGEKEYEIALKGEVKVPRVPVLHSTKDNLTWGGVAVSSTK